MMRPLELLRLEKAAADCGFDLTPALLSDGGLEMGSAQFPETVVVHVDSDSFRILASAAALLNGTDGGALSVSNIDELYAALQHASAIARTMPNRVADRFRRAKLRLPESTEAERLIVQRVGQELFRDALMDYWQSRCCVTGLAIPALLRASHIKPWAKCDGDNERLDVFNGLLLAPHVDALFDGGWISFSDDGTLLISDALAPSARVLLGVSVDWSIRDLKPAHVAYLAFHRANELRKAS